MTVHHDKLYHLDANGNTRVWWIEQDGANVRSHAGILGGAIVTSDWKTSEGKNLGRSNETTPENQASLEIVSMYTNRLERKYSKTPETAARSNFFQPMLAATFKPHPTKNRHMSGWYTQPKYDGIRCITSEEGGFSRAGKPFQTVGHILDEVLPIMEKHGVLLDGELYNHEYKADFNKITSLIKQQKFDSLSQAEKDEIADKVQLHVYDLVNLNDLSMPFKDRIQMVYDILQGGHLRTVKICPTDILHDIEEIEQKHGEYLEEGYEGLMLRDPESPYENKRCKALQKHKSFKEEEFPVLAIEEGVGNWAGAAKTAILQMPNGLTSSAGIMGSYEDNARILREKDRYIGGDATTKFQDFTPDGRLRFGIVKVFHGGRREM